MIQISELPIAYHCRACGFIKRQAVCNSYPVKCPNCGETNMHHGIKRLPTVCIYVGEPASYNFCNSNDKNCQVYISIDGKTKFAFLTDDNFHNEFEQSDDIMSDLNSFKHRVPSRKSSEYDKFLAEEIYPNLKIFSLNLKKNKKEQLLRELYETYEKFQDVVDELEEPCGED